MIRINEAKIALKQKKKLNDTRNADEDTKISLQQFVPLSEAEIQGLLHPAQANLEFLAWFQSLQLPSTV
jgi:hypothetical protein